MIFCKICNSQVVNGRCQVCGNTDRNAMKEEVKNEIIEKVIIDNEIPEKKEDDKMKEQLMKENEEIRIKRKNKEREEEIKSMKKYNISEAFVETEFNVQIEGLVFGMSGFAQAVRNIALGMYKKYGNKTILVPHSHANENEPVCNAEHMKLLRSMIETKPKFSKKISIVTTIPLGIKPRKDYYNIGFAMFETQDMPKEFTDHLMQMDELWTPSKFNYKGFINSGFTKPLKVMPLGVNTSEFDPEKVKPLNIHNKKKFTFLSIMGFSERKGIEPLVRAFCEEFKSSDDVCLLIKGGWYDKFEAIKYITEIIENKVRNKKLPKILYHFDILQQKDMPRLYKACDCFVLPSRGEGWGLNYTEAMSMAMPVIGTNATSQKDFMNKDNSYLIDVEGFEKEPRCDWICEYYKGRKFANPSISHLRKLMRDVYKNKQKAVKKGKQARKDMVEKYDWKLSIDKMCNRINEIIRGDI